LRRGLRAIITRTIAYDEKMIGAEPHIKTPLCIYGRAKEPCPRCRTGGAITSKARASDLQ
jgi:formamidopyrimidine-DNA glycosylase